MRGGAIGLAAQLLCALSVLTVPTAGAQAVRTRDVGFATVRYDNGLGLGALSLYEAIGMSRATGDLNANWLLSLFSDGRWSTQANIVGSRQTTPVPLAEAFQRYFTTMRGEVVLDGGTSAQQGLMPTFQLLATSRLRFASERRGLNIGASLARTFDGMYWRTTVLAEGSGAVRRGSSEFRLVFTPMQLAGGDVMADWEGGTALALGRVAAEATAGVRLGEAQRGTVGWGSATLVVPWHDDLIATFSLGSYPADLLQGLPGGRYVAVNFRVPRDRLPWTRRRTVAPPAPTRPRPPALSFTDRLAIAIGEPYDSASLREVRVWAPGIQRVELIADFTQWIPVPLIKVTAGEWHGYYHIPPGAHRLNLLLNGVELDVPANLVRVIDDFNGAVGLVIVR
ncbi:MAG: hypothetical protein MNPFHGCM_02333 [Gemmatimonadaceae bacterium]|nr:hypothetical protein [Gemmatimonadaceae bacterium]